MAERKDGDANHGPQDFLAAMRQGQCTRHHAEAEGADSRRHHIAMFPDAAAECDQPEQDREDQADLVDRGVQERARCRGEREQYRAGQAMRQAQARQADREAIEPCIDLFPESGCKRMSHARHIEADRRSYNITSTINCARNSGVLLAFMVGRA